MPHIVPRGNNYEVHVTEKRNLGVRTTIFKPPKVQKRSSVINKESISEAIELQLAQPSINHLGFHGFRRISGSSFAAQISWSFLCIVFLTMCIFQCYDRVKMFMYNPSSVNMRLQRNATLSAPSITICPSEQEYKNPSVWKPWLRDLHNITSFTNAFELLERTNMSIDDLWNISRIGMTKLKYGTPKAYSLMNGLRTDSTSIQMEELYTTAGICTTLKAKKPLDCEGVRANLFAEGDGFSDGLHYEYSVIFHPDEDAAIMQYFVRHFEVQVPFGSETLVGIRLQEFTFLNTWATPCSDPEAVTKCYTECLENKIFLNINKSFCSLPYMRLNDSFPPCETQEEFHDVYSATDAATSGFDWESCGCPRKCKEIVYLPEFYYALALPDEHRDDQLFRLYITFSDCRVEVVEEVITYSFFSLFSDIGGTLGLFLGISVLSLCELFEVMFQKLFNRRLGNS